jgi:NADH-quinone oxidoreductase subunit L
VRGAKVLGRFTYNIGDNKLIDGLGPDGLSSLSKAFAQQMSKLQTGYIYHYAFAVVLGLVAFLLWLGRPI